MSKTAKQIERLAKIYQIREDTLEEWAKALGRYSADEVSHGVDAVIAEHRYATVKPADLIERIEGSIEKKRSWADVLAGVAWTVAVEAAPKWARESRHTQLTTADLRNDIGAAALVYLTPVAFAVSARQIVYGDAISQNTERAYFMRLFRANVDVSMPSRKMLQGKIDETRALLDQHVKQAQQRKLEAAEHDQREQQKLSAGYRPMTNEDFVRFDKMTQRVTKSMDDLQ